MMPSKKFGLKQSKTSRGDFQQYSFSEVDAATDYFAPANKLGEGGFGPVYKVKDSLFYDSKCHPIDGQRVLTGLPYIGHPAGWTTNCSEKALKKFRTRAGGVHE